MSVVSVKNQKRLFQKGDVILNKRINEKGRVNWVREEEGIFGYTLIDSPGLGDVIKLDCPDFELVRRAKRERVRRTRKRERVRRIKKKEPNKTKGGIFF